MSIPISKDGGLEPHLTTCTMCGGPGEALAVRVMRKAQDSKGHWHYCNRGKTHAYNQQLLANGYESISGWEPVKAEEKIPLGICNTCQKAIDDNVAEQKQAIAEGGIYVKCKCCNMEGVLSGNTELAKRVREHSGVKAPAPVGMEFDDCSQHPAPPTQH